MTDNPKKSVRRPKLTASFCPPDDFTGDPKNGVVFYYCPTKGCKGLWGVQWKEADTSPGVVRVDEYKEIATEKLCLTCMESEDSLHMLPWKEFSASMKKMSLADGKDDTEKRKAKHDIKKAKEDADESGNGNSRGDFHNDIVDGTQEDELWVMIESQDADDEPWHVL